MVRRLFMLLFAAGLIGLGTDRPPLTKALSVVRPGIVLVKLQPGYSLAQLDGLLEQINAQVTGALPELNVLVLDVPLGQERALAAFLRAIPAVAYAEPDFRAVALSAPNDPLWRDQWNLQHIGVDRAWDYVPSAQGVVIAVLDTGIKLDHPDLSAALWTNPGEIPGNEQDDDGNGKVDDVYGWHFYHLCTVVDCQVAENNDPSDDNGHGTHVAGIAGAVTNNTLGIAGIARGGRLMAVKVLDDMAQGWYSDVAKGIVYATDNGARIINLSLGGEEPSDVLRDAVDYAVSRDVLLVAAAGNNGAAVWYPAAYAPVLAVGMTNSADELDPRSNRGAPLDLVAPGVDILSTWIYPLGYRRRSGTSMAAPHVSGLAALLWGIAPEMSAEQVANLIIRSAVDLGPPGWDEGYGYGRVDALRAVEQIVPMTFTPTPTTTPYPTASPTVTPSLSPTVTVKASATSTATPTYPVLPVVTTTATPSRTPRPPVTGTPWPTATPTATSSRTPHPSATVTPSFTPAATTTPSPTLTITPSDTPEPSPTATATAQPTIPVWKVFIPFLCLNR